MDENDELFADYHIIFDKLKNYYHR